MLTTFTLQDTTQAEIRSEAEGRRDDVIRADNSNVGAVIRRAQRGKGPRSPERESVTATDVSEVVAAEGSWPKKRHMSYHRKDARDESQEDGRSSLSGV